MFFIQCPYCSEQHEGQPVVVNVHGFEREMFEIRCPETTPFQVFEQSNLRVSFDGIAVTR